MIAVYRGQIIHSTENILQLYNSIFMGMHYSTVDIFLPIFHP